MSSSRIAPPHVTTGDALAQVRALLEAIDHDARHGLSTDSRFELAELAVDVGRRVDALRAVLVAEADRARTLTDERRDQAEQWLLERAQRMSAQELAQQTRAVLNQVAPRSTARKTSCPASTANASKPSPPARSP